VGIPSYAFSIFVFAVLVKAVFFPWIFVKKHLVNPMTGCLPLLLQLPIFVVLFQVLREFDFDLLRGLGDGFFWIENLGYPDPWVLPVIVVVSTFLLLRYSLMIMPQTAEGTAKYIQIGVLYVVPLLMGWFSRSYPAGLDIYWIAFSLLSVFQQWIIDRIPMDIPPDLQESRPAMYCYKCGNQVAEGVKFCRKCGAKLNAESMVQQPKN
jgi:membrane protein insertase Oxa1/YidC/SpoIIIJ